MKYTTTSGKQYSPFQVEYLQWLRRSVANVVNHIRMKDSDNEDILREAAPLLSAVYTGGSVGQFSVPSELDKLYNLFNQLTQQNATTLFFALEKEALKFMMRLKGQLYGIIKHPHFNGDEAAIGRVVVQSVYMLWHNLLKSCKIFVGLLIQFHRLSVREMGLNFTFTNVNQLLFRETILQDPIISRYLKIAKIMMKATPQSNEDGDLWPEQLRAFEGDIRALSAQASYLKNQVMMYHYIKIEQKDPTILPQLQELFHELDDGLLVENLVSDETPTHSDKPESNDSGTKEEADNEDPLSPPSHPPTSSSLEAELATTSEFGAIDSDDEYYESSEDTNYDDPYQDEDVDDILDDGDDDDDESDQELDADSGSSSPASYDHADLVSLAGESSLPEPNLPRVRAVMRGLRSQLGVASLRSRTVTTGANGAITVTEEIDLGDDEFDDEDGGDAPGGQSPRAHRTPSKTEVTSAPKHDPRSIEELVSFIENRAPAATKKKRKRKKKPTTASATGDIKGTIEKYVPPSAALPRFWEEEKSVDATAAAQIDKEVEGFEARLNSHLHKAATAKLKADQFAELARFSREHSRNIFKHLYSSTGSSVHSNNH